MIEPEALNNPIDAITLLQSVSFDSEKKHLYSNSNYLLLGKIIEEMSSNSLDQVFEKTIKVPAKMEFSFAPISGNYFALKKMKAYSKLVPNLNDKVFIDMTNAVGAGNVISTISDLVKWGEYLFKKAPRLIVDRMFKNYGKDPDGDIINLGFGTMDTRLGPFIGHQGGLDSYSSFFGYVPYNDTLILILSNNNNDANELMQTISEWLSQAALNIKQEKILSFWSKKLIDDEHARAFSEKYNNAHPNAEKNGYGPGAMIVYKGVK